jgi:hypothetical protein
MAFWRVAAGGTGATLTPSMTRRTPLERDRCLWGNARTVPARIRVTKPNEQTDPSPQPSPLRKGRGRIIGSAYGLVGAWNGVLLLLPLAALAGPVTLRIASDPDCARVQFLGWDTEGGQRANTNLLRTGIGMGLRIRSGGQWREAEDLPTQRERTGKNTTRYRLAVSADAHLVWSLETKGASLVTRISGQGMEAVEAVELMFPFDPKVTPTTALPKAWTESGELLLPAIISAPDYGQFLLACKGAGEVKGRLEGSRAKHAVDLIIALPRLRNNQTCTLSLTPVHLSAPKGLKDKSLWEAARRGWFGALQCSAKWGDPGNPFSAPAGMLANNVVSDPASSSLWFYADQAFGRRSWRRGFRRWRWCGARWIGGSIRRCCRAAK